MQTRPTRAPERCALLWTRHAAAGRALEDQNCPAFASREHRTGKAHARMSVLIDCIDNAGREPPPPAPAPVSEHACTHCTASSATGVGNGGVCELGSEVWASVSTPPGRGRGCETSLQQLRDLVHARRRLAPIGRHRGKVANPFNFESADFGYLSLFFSCEQLGPPQTWFLLSGNKKKRLASVIFPIEFYRESFRRNKVTSPGHKLSRCALS